jgi:hypothetical protein
MLKGDRTMKMRPFKQTDWDAFAGAEGTHPEIGEGKITLEHGETVDAVVIADATAVAVNAIDEDGNFLEWYSFDLHLRRGSEQRITSVIAALLPERMTHSMLVGLGFICHEV